MDNEYPDIDGIEMLSQPLLTEEGFLNEACLNELAAAIRNMPETYERLANDKEWAIQYGTTLTEVMSAFGSACIQLACGTVPPGFENVFGYLRSCLVSSTFKECHSQDIDFRYAELSLCEINKLLWDILGELEAFKAWNTTDCLGDKWVDLSALLHLVCIIIRNERRHCVAFDIQLEKNRS
jgi:hypothetical protein